MSTILVVPIHLDALHVKAGMSLVGPMADFSRSPYFDGVQDVNPEVPNISEGLLSTPLEDVNFHLKAGVHLHWALPDALTKGVHTEAGTTFPWVPNRWLVTRLKNNVVEKQWVVESDYISKEGQGVTIPWPSDSSHPYRYLGRQMPLDIWPDADSSLSEAHISDGDLTSIGPLKSVETLDYVKASFAAFYPNCYSVFGFWDAELTESAALTEVQYEVIGWYSDATKDALLEVLQKLGTTVSAEIQKGIKDKFGWKIAGTDKTALNQSMQLVCYAHLNFTPKTSSVSPQAPALAIGDTGTEALSAYLANTIDPTNKSIIEEQLECLQLSSKLEGHQLDLGAKFKEARHEKSFGSLLSGVLWTIKPEMKTSNLPANAQDAEPQALLTLPANMAHDLNQLNLRQQQYDQACHELEGMRQQIFCDWHKYMQASYPPEESRYDYPDPDEIEFFLNRQIDLYNAKLNNLGQLELQYDPQTKTVTSARDKSTGSSSSLAARLASQIKTTLQAITAHNDSQNQNGSQTVFRLRHVAAPRYWQPNNPVLLMTGEVAKFTERHGQDGDLTCALISDGSIAYPLTQNSLAALRSQIGPLSLAPISSKSWQKQPWNPFLLEWEVEFFPTQDGSNIEQKNQLEINDSHKPGYREDFITANYTLEQQKADLALKAGKRVVKGANIYRGFSILTPHAGIQLKTKVAAYLQEQVLADFCKNKTLTEPSDDVAGFLNKHIADIKTWYEGTHSELDNDLKKAQDSVYTAIRAYEQVEDLTCLSQALGGFNEGLIMQKQTMEWPISYPLAFQDYRSLTTNVTKAVGQSLQKAPLPFDDFNPIRAGMMRLLNLRLVDTFGQYRDLEVSDFVTTESMTSPQTGRLWLPPRLAQPARLNFRWISAKPVNGQDEPEMNAHPATSPVCGWIIPNNFDNSLMIYDLAGKALGSIDEEARWEVAPGGTSPAPTAEQISNPHLKRMVQYLIAQGKTFLSDFISTLDSALENIDPENFAQHEGLALLMGRPIAVVRAVVSFELQSLPAIHQGWNMLRLDMRRRRGTREHDAFTKVQVPIRIGEYQQLNDGLVGYWKEEADHSYEDSVFYALESTAGVTNNQIKSHSSAEPLNISLALDSPPQTLTMLLDPRSKIHATSGILPTKTLEIPPEQYTAALQAMEVTLLTAPILTPVAEIDLPLPTEPCYAWSWLEKDNNGTWTDNQKIGKVNRQASFSAQPAQIREGWLKLSHLSKK